MADNDLLQRYQNAITHVVDQHPDPNKVKLLFDGIVKYDNGAEWLNNTLNFLDIKIPRQTLPSPSDGDVNTTGYQHKAYMTGGYAGFIYFVIYGESGEIKKRFDAKFWGFSFPGGALM